MKGKILLIGGGEYRGPHPEDEPLRTEDIKKEFSPLEQLCRDPKHARIEIVTTGTSYPRESFERYENYFHAMGVNDVNMLDMDSPHLKPEQIKAIEKANVVFLGGGNQRKLLEILGDTEVPLLLRKRLKEDKDFILGGTSAGSMVLGELMVGDGYERTKFLKGDVDIRKGMNLLPGIIIDTHFLESMRLSRLSMAVLENPTVLGIGLSENTGVIVRDGDLLEAVGEDVILLLDASDVKKSNLKTAKKNDPVTAIGMKVHFLSRGTSFSIRNRNVVRESFADQKK